jgi:hypothetical protein
MPVALACAHALLKAAGLYSTLNTAFLAVRAGAYFLHSLNSAHCLRGGGGDRVGARRLGFGRHGADAGAPANGA